MYVLYGRTILYMKKIANILLAFYVQSIPSTSLSWFSPSPQL